jgi:hypothetical protein
MPGIIQSSRNRSVAPVSKLPHCVACLYAIGWGIKRIVRHTGFAKTTVHRFARGHGLIDPETAADKHATENMRRTQAAQLREAIRRQQAEARKAERAAERAARPKRKPNIEKERKRARTNAKMRYDAMQRGGNEHLKRLLRCRIYNAIRRQSEDRGRSDRKAMRTHNLIGCTLGQLRQHIESMFKPGMSWDNMGEWHIDHRRPCATFDLTNPEQQKECFNWRNLQPLWAGENLRKSDSYANAA